MRDGLIRLRIWLTRARRRGKLPVMKVLIPGRGRVPSQIVEATIVSVGSEEQSGGGGRGQGILLRVPPGVIQPVPPGSNDRLAVLVELDVEAGAGEKVNWLEAAKSVVEAVRREESARELDPEWLITAAEVRGLGVRERILKANAPFLKLMEAARVLTMSKAGAHERLIKGRLLGIKIKDEWHLPAWQFSDGDLIDGLAPVLEKLEGQAELARAGFFVLPNSLLEERTPREALEAGDWKPVVAAAAAFGTQAAR